MITSFIDGRVRIRRDELKDPDIMDLVMGLVKARDGIIDLVPNPRTGSLLITYDPEIISRETLAQAAETLEKQFGGKTGAASRSGKRRKKLSPLAETGILAGLYGLTFVTGMVSKRAHIASALLFTALTTAHVYNRRRCL